MQNTPDKDDLGFSIRISVANALSYLLATITPLVVDPKIFHHVRHGARDYAIGWWVLQIGVAVGVVTFFVMARAQKRNKVFWNSVPLLLVGILTLPFYLPEFPHGYVTSVVATCSVISTVATWIHIQPLQSEFASDLQIDRSARLERVKEEILFWRASMTTVLGASLAATISWFICMKELNKQITTDVGEQFLLNCAMSHFAGFALIWVLMGPLAESGKKCRDAMNLLLKIPNK